MKIGEFLTALKKELTPHYVAQGCHDLTHVLRMEAMADEMAGFFSDLDKDQFRIAVWLHNLDRCAGYQEQIKKNGLEFMLYFFLSGTDFPEPYRHQIVRAVLEHSKFLDGENDSTVLHALRLADKWDRIGLLGAISGFQWLGNKLPAYDPAHPFGYGSTAEGNLEKGGKGGYTTLYQNLYRILEWYPTFPRIRELVKRHPRRFWTFLGFVRSFGEEVALAHGVPNNSEADIERCLGEYYLEWREVGAPADVLG